MKSYLGREQDQGDQCATLAGFEALRATKYEARHED